MARARNSKGRFVKGGKSKALVRYRTKAITKYRTRTVRVRGRSRRTSKGGGLSIGKVAVAGLALGVLAGDNAIGKQVKPLVDKLPGTKTFGVAATTGIACLAINRWLKPHPWLRAAGLIGIGLAAVEVGKQGDKFKWLGDVEDDDDFVADVE